MKNVHSICQFVLLPCLSACITFDPIFQEETVEMEGGRPRQNLLLRFVASHLLKLSTNRFFQINGEQPKGALDTKVRKHQKMDFCLLASFCEQNETENLPITQYILINRFPDAKVTLQQILYFFVLEYSSCVIVKVTADTYSPGPLQQLFIKTSKTQFKQDFTKIIVTRGGWLQGYLLISLPELQCP